MPPARSFAGNLAQCRRHDDGLEPRGKLPRARRATAEQKSNPGNVSSLVDTPAPYAGPNRIRFNGFTGEPHGQPASQV